MQYAYLPFKYLGISQGVNGSYSHKGLNAIDFGWKTGYDYKNLYAPFDCQVVHTESNGCVVIESVNPVEWADGTKDYMTIITYHHLKKNIPANGATFKQGEVYTQMGNNGASLHTHLEVQKGHFQLYTGVQVTGTSGAKSYIWPDTVKPYEVLYVWNDAQYSPNAAARPYVWKTVEEKEETDYKSLYESLLIKYKSICDICNS